jgi:hypothetical protein
MSGQELSNDIILIKDMLSRLNDRQAEMEATLSEIGTSLTKLHTRILGDEEYGQKGLIEEVNEIKKYISNDKSVKQKLYGGLTVVAILWTLIWEYIKTKFIK